MEKLPQILLDFNGLYTVDTCAEFCRFMANELDVESDDEPSEELLYWRNEANQFLMQSQLGLRGSCSHPKITEEIEKNPERWASRFIDKKTLYGAVWA